MRRLSNTAIKRIIAGSLALALTFTSVGLNNFTWADEDEVEEVQEVDVDKNANTDETIDQGSESELPTDEVVTSDEETEEVVSNDKETEEATNAEISEEATDAEASEKDANSKDATSESADTEKCEHEDTDEDDKTGYIGNFAMRPYTRVENDLDSRFVLSGRTDKTYPTPQQIVKVAAGNCRYCQFKKVLHHLYGQE